MSAGQDVSAFATARRLLAEATGCADSEVDDQASIDSFEPWDSLAQLRQALVAEHPHLGQIDEVPENEWQMVQGGSLSSEDFVNPIKDFYLTNPIARASEVMAELSAMNAPKAMAAE